MAALLAIATIATAKDQRLSPGRAGEIVGLWQDVSVNDDIVKEDYAASSRSSTWTRMESMRSSI
ncbi:hypothetical protein [Xanthomonas arboricola]|uniref:hypothetical protein n=1 Tax=Xanthomonas arboricola TaxID=56448 RepID=UPI0011B016B4|nr:hypothetical protein [Xanthomonas arboricola]